MNETKNNEVNLEKTLYDEINLLEIFKLWWEERWTVIIITFFVAIGSIFYSLSLSNYYKSEALLISSDNKSTNFSLSQYSGLASLAGIELPGSSGDNTFEMLEIIKSREFVRHLLSFENILPSLMAPKRYDLESKKLFFDSEIFDANSKWIGNSFNGKNIPSYLETHKNYLDSLTVLQDKKTGFIVLKFEHISPIFARDFLELIIEEANKIKRKKDLETSSKALDFLNSELAKTPYLEIKKSINQIIETQLETQMLAKVNEEYVLSVIEPPYEPEIKSKPKRSIIVIASTIFGGLFGLFFILLRHFFKRIYHERNKI